MKRLHLRTVVGALVLALLALVLRPLSTVSIGQEQDQPTNKRSRFMRQKLEFSKGVVEGLALEDYALIAKSAKALKRLSEAAEWEVPTIPNIQEYVPQTTEFQRLADELEQKAKDRSIDGATLAYFQLTMSCVKCHKHVRTVTK